MTIFIIDRFLQAEGLSLKRNRFQLLGVSAMFIASKVSSLEKSLFPKKSALSGFSLKFLLLVSLFPKVNFHKTNFS